MIPVGMIGSDEIGGTAREKVTHHISGCIIQRGSIERCFHKPQPGAARVRANGKACMGFAQAQPPSMLRLFLVSAQELNEGCGKLFRSTPQALAWEKRAKNRVFANARVERRGELPATLFTTKCFQQCTPRTHGS